MKLYCDGSLHLGHKIIGIGIACEEFKDYIEIKKNDLSSQEHEIEALISTINIGLSKGYRKFTVVNDDKGLINTTNRHLKKEKVKCKGLLQKKRYLHLLSLVKTHNIKLCTISSADDKPYIKMCHELSRSYLKPKVKKVTKKKKRDRKKMSSKYKVPEKLFVGHINPLNVNQKERNAMEFYYGALVDDMKFSIDDILEWVKDKPSINTRNGRKYVIAQFVSEFCRN